MIKVLFYAYSLGITSSREIEDHLRRDAAFMFLAAMQKPDYRTICLFRTKYLDCVVSLFRQILQVCDEMDMVGMVNVSIDGTKIKANASRKRSKDAEQIDKEIKRWMETAERADSEEDDLYGDGSPFILPPELVDRRTREEKIEEALRRVRELENAKKKLDESGLKTINMTDPDARMMKSGRLIRPCYNGQLAVDSKCQVIVACDLTTCEVDYDQLVPMVEQIEMNLGELPISISADSGYASYDNLEYLPGREILGLIPDQMLKIEEAGKNKYFSRNKFVYDASLDRYTCPGGKLLTHQNRQKMKDGAFTEKYMAKDSDCAGCGLKSKCTKAKKRFVSRNPREHLFEEMRERLKTPLGKALYKLRKITVEPVNGNIKYNKGFSEFSLRGLSKTRIELVMMSIVHNIRKIHDVLNDLIPLTA
ncbi:MAG: Transposase DDE domain protein [Methanocella sp. PtaU1.Bin125]|nr:MAG: Transposase DDE domain protein [Methanocella sp. PtaU1.Bin125]